MGLEEAVRDGCPQDAEARSSAQVAPSGSPFFERLWLRYSLLAAATWACLAVLLASRRVLVSVGWVLLASAAVAWLVKLEQGRRRVDSRAVVAAIGLVLVLAVVVPPRTSNDIWSYAMYGRTVTVHHANPYQRVPADFPSDPFLARVSPRWRHTGSVYGPLFVGIATADALVAGDSPTASRAFFQLLAALAFVVILAIVWRRTRSAAAILWLGLNPVAVIVVNGGHNDVLVGLALLVAAILFQRRNACGAGIAVGLAMLVKLTAALGLIGLVLWAWNHGERRGAWRAAIAACIVVAVGYAPVIIGAAHVLGGANKTVTKASFWNLLVDRILHHDAGRNVLTPLAPNTTLTIVFYASMTVVLLLAVGLGARASRHRRPEPSVGASVASYTMAAEYTFPWYAIWALPQFATRRISGVAWVVWWQSVVMLAALRLPDAVNGSPLHAIARTVLTMVAPIVLFSAFIATAWRDGRPRQAPELTTTAHQTSTRRSSEAVLAPTLRQSPPGSSACGG
jgi:alpha-1,6-mannosyltransferase